MRAAASGHSPELAVALVDRDLRIVLFEGLGARARRLAAGRARRPHDRRGAPAERAEEMHAARRDGARGPAPARSSGPASRSELMFRIDVMPFGEGGEITHAVLTFRDIGAERGAAAHARGAARVPVRGARAARRARPRRRRRRPAAVASTAASIDDELHPLEWSEHFGLRHPDGTPFGPHEAPLLRALRGEQVRDVEVHVETAEGRARCSRAAGR